MTRIKECLDRMGQTQKWLAITMGVKQPSVHDWITGKNTPSSENLKRLSELFHVSVDYLLGISDDTPPVVSTDPWDPEEMDAADREDETIRVLARGVQRMAPENRQKLLDVARALFKDDFDDQGNKKR